MNYLTTTPKRVTLPAIALISKIYEGSGMWDIAYFSQTVG